MAYDGEVRIDTRLGLNDLTKDVKKIKAELAKLEKNSHVGIEANTTGAVKDIEKFKGKIEKESVTMQIYPSMDTKELQQLIDFKKQIEKSQVEAPDFDHSIFKVITDEQEKQIKNIIEQRRETESLKAATDDVAAAQETITELKGKDAYATRDILAEIDALSAAAERLQMEPEGGYIPQLIEQAQNAASQIAIFESAISNLREQLASEQDPAMIIALQHELTTTQAEFDKFLGSIEKPVADVMFTQLNEELKQVQFDIGSIQDAISQETDFIMLRGLYHALDNAEIKAEELQRQLGVLQNAGSANFGGDVEDQSRRAGEALRGIGTAAAGAAQVAGGALRRIGGAIAGIASGSLRAIRGVGSLVKNLFSLNRHSRSTSRGIGRITNSLSKMVMAAFVFNVLRKGMRQLAQDMRGLLMQNEQFAASWNAIKVNLLTAFAPLWEVIQPAILTFMDLLARFTAVLAQFMALLFGRTVSQARDSAKALNDQKKALDGVGGAADKASGKLAKFDQINQLAADSAGGGGAGGAGELDWSIDIQEFSWLDEFKDKLLDIVPDLEYFFELGQNLANKIADGLWGINWDNIQTWANSLGQKLGAFLSGFLTSESGRSMLRGIANTVIKGIETALNFLLGLGTAFNFPGFGSALADAINWAIRNFKYDLLAKTINTWWIGFLDFLNAAITGIDWRAFGTNVAGMLNSIAWRDIFEKSGELFANILNAIVEFLASFAEEFDFIEFGKSLAAGLNKFFKTFDFIRLAEGINAWVKGLLDLVITFLKDTDWADIGRRIGEFIAAIDWGGIISKLFETISLLFNASFDLLGNLLGGGYFADKLGKILAGAIAGLTVGGAHGALAGAVMGFIYSLAEMLADGTDYVVDAISDLITYGYVGGYEDAAQEWSRMWYEEQKKRAQLAYEEQVEILRITSAWGGAFVDLYQLWGEASQQIVRFADNISEETKAMLDPFISNADKARIALLNIFLEGKPVSEADTIEISGYVKDMANTAVGELERMKNAALENLAWIYGEEAMDFEKRLAESNSFYNARVADIERERRALEDNVRAAILLADEEIRVNGEVSQSTQQALDEARAAYESYSAGAVIEIENIRKAQADYETELRTEFGPKVAEGYFDIRDNVQQSYTDQLSAVESDSKRMADILAANMQEGQELTLTSLNAMTTNLEAFTRNGIALLTTDAHERKSIIETRDKDLLVMDQLAGQERARLMSEQTDTEMAEIEKRYGRATAVADAEYQRRRDALWAWEQEQWRLVEETYGKLEDMTSESYQEQYNIISEGFVKQKNEIDNWYTWETLEAYNQQQDQLAALGKKYDAFQERSKAYQGEMYTITYEGAQATGIAFGRGIITAIDGSGKSMRDSWSDSLREMVEAGNNAMGIRSPSKVTEQQGDSMIEGLKVSVNKGKPVLVGLVKELMQGMVNAITSFKNSFVNSFISTYNLALAATEAWANNLVDAVRQACERVKGMLMTLNPTFTMTLPPAGTLFVPKIPMLARGGIIDHATIAMLGEKGREAVVPLDNNTDWLKPILDRLEAIEDRLRNNNGQDKEAVLNVNGREFARATWGDYEYEGRRRGDRIGGKRLGAV